MQRAPGTRPSALRVRSVALGAYGWLCEGGQVGFTQNWAPPLELGGHSQLSGHCEAFLQPIWQVPFTQIRRESFCVQTSLPVQLRLMASRPVEVESALDTGWKHSKRACEPGAGSAPGVKAMRCGSVLHSFMTSAEKSS